MGLGTMASGSLAGLGLMGGIAGGPDMALLCASVPIDLESQQKYEAMGLPDPVAFAALAALGAIPNPMQMLNAMMHKAQERIDKDGGSDKARGPPVSNPPLSVATPAPPLTTPQAPEPPRATGAIVPPPGPSFAVPSGKSFVEAFQDLQRAHEDRSGERLPGPVQNAWAEPPLPAYVEKVTSRDAAEVNKLEERLKNQAKELAEQAKFAAVRRAKDPSGGWSSTPRENQIGLTQAFRLGAEDDPTDEQEAHGGRGQPGFTLSALLTGGGADQHSAASTSNSFPAAVSGPDKLYVGNLPGGCNDAVLRSECAKHGAVLSIIFQADGAGAYVSFASSEMAATAARRMAGRPGLLGGKEPLEVRLVSDVPDVLRLALAPPPTFVEDAKAVAELPEYLKPHDSGKLKTRRSRSRSRRKRSRDKKKKKTGKGASWLDRSRSNSHTATGQYIRATGCSSTVRWWEKKRETSSSASRSRSRARRPSPKPRSRSASRSRRRSSSRRGRKKEKEREGAKSAEPPKKSRQVAIKGAWAQFVNGGFSFYYCIGTGLTSWDRPGDLDDPLKAAAYALAFAPLAKLGGPIAKLAGAGTTGPTSTTI